MQLDEVFSLFNSIDDLINEGFKDDMYRLYPDGKDNDAFNKAIKDYNSPDNKIKDMVKRKVSINGNVAKSIKELYPTPAKFVEFINSLTQSIKDKEEYKEIKQGKAKSNSKDFWLIPCHTFEEAHKAASMYSGGLPRLSNKEIEERYGIEAPGEGSQYKTNKTPEEFLEYMKNEKNFFMMPSWCVAAGKGYFNTYSLKTEPNESPLMIVVISKVYPNVRFAIVLRKYVTFMKDHIESNIEILEVRDPWQIGDMAETGTHMMELMFGENIVHDIIKKFGSDESIKNYEKYIVNGYNLSRGDDNEKVFTINIDFPNLKYGDYMFGGYTELREFKGALPKLTRAHEMFANCYYLKKFENDLPSLVDGKGMFERCDFLKSFKGDLSSLKDGRKMFYMCSGLADFEGNLSSLENGEGMFGYCKLNQKSVENILNSVPSYPQNEKRMITIGVHYMVDTLRLKGLFMKKGWDVVFDE